MSRRGDPAPQAPESGRAGGRKRGADEGCGGNVTLQACGRLRAGLRGGEAGAAALPLLGGAGRRRSRRAGGAGAGSGPSRSRSSGTVCVPGSLSETLRVREASCVFGIN